jgi:hypothetical protein
LYEPAILVVGTRGKSLGGFQGLLPGSVSKYCLQHSPVPVIVVRPSSKRDKARSKRANDPDRHGYRDILAKSESLLDVNSPRNSFFANDEEASAVAAAMAASKPSADTHPLAQVAHVESSSDEEDDHEADVGPLDGMRSPAVLMKSPHLQNLDSPELSSESSSEDEDDHGGVSTIVADENDVSPGTIAPTMTPSALSDSTSHAETLVEATEAAKALKLEDPPEQVSSEKSSEKA